MGTIRNSFVPAKYGLFTGFDIGRVWLENDFSNKWHNSYGGGIWLNAANVVTGKVSYFHGEDGSRVSVGFGFGF